MLEPERTLVVGARPCSMGLGECLLEDIESFLGSRG